jgi:hypothetical protein
MAAPEPPRGPAAPAPASRLGATPGLAPPLVSRLGAALGAHKMWH